MDHNAGAARALELVRQQAPLVHNITNYVVMNNTANALLACGASPVMAHARQEVEEMAAMAGALVINIGTLSPPWIEAMLAAGQKANEVGAPVVLDPVGSGATTLRTETAMRLLAELDIAVVRANASEALSLRPGLAGAGKGVDSRHQVDEALEAAKSLALELGAVLAVTGRVDLVTDGRRALRVAGGHELMGRVTGMGCTATALVGAFLAVEPDPLAAAAGALAYLGLAGRQAAAWATGPGSFQVALLDALYNIDPPSLQTAALIAEA